MNRLCFLFLLLSFSLFSKALAQNFTEVAGTPFAGVALSSIAFADVDGDNDLDVLITGLNLVQQGTPGTPISRLYTNDGVGNYTEVLGTPFVGVEEGSVAFADVDGDNDQDVLITGSYSSKLYTNDGSGNFTEVIGTPFQGVNESSIAFADVDGDNDQDVLITGRQVASPVYISTSRLYLNDGSGSFTEMMNPPFGGVRDGSIAFVDVDGDTDQDVLITGLVDQVGLISKLYTNDGLGNFTEMMNTPFDGVWGGEIAFADVDGDNDQDLLLTGQDAANQYISKLYTNGGSGNFTEMVGTPFAGVVFSGVAFVDVDGDTDQDLLMSGGTGIFSLPYTRLFANDGLGNFSEVAGTPFPDVTNGSVAFADVDGDNDQDVLLTGRDINIQYMAKLYTNGGRVLSLSEESGVEPSVSSPPSNRLNLTPYPNPATSDKLSVRFNSAESSEINVRVYDAHGRLMREQQASAGTGEQTLEVDIAALPAGSYFLRLHDGRKSSVARFRVQ